ncbi:hypothetical protein DFJ74DRAFT_686317 [Hyaloraphidium curvatum]|nr:hypothetical protein DFJ74DRAFT_686317 [Hyaloraphidium curvatum]
MIASFALPPCPHLDSPFCGDACERFGCGCWCLPRRKLAAKLCRVSWLFFEVASPRIWECVQLEVSKKKAPSYLRRTGTESDRVKLEDDDTLATIACNLSYQRKLKSVSIRGSALFHATDFLTSLDPRLEHLLAHNADCDVLDWITVFEGLPKLKTLSVSGVLEMSSPFDAIASCCPRSLESLLLGPWTRSEAGADLGMPIVAFADEDFRGFVDSVDSITRLRLHSCGEIGDGAFHSAFAKARKMTLLDLRNTSISDGPLSELQTTSLALLDLGFTQVSDAAVVRLAEANPGLRVVRLRATEITDASVEAIVKSARNLAELDISFTSVSSATISALTGSRRPLLSLSVAGLSAVDDASIVALAAAFPNLRELNIYGCEGIADAETMFAVAYALRRTVLRCNFGGIPVVDAEPGMEEALAYVMDV